MVNGAIIVLIFWSRSIVSINTDSNETVVTSITVNLKLGLTNKAVPPPLAPHYLIDETLQ